MLAVNIPVNIFASHNPKLINPGLFLKSSTQCNQSAANVRVHAPILKQQISVYVDFEQIKCTGSICLYEAIMTSQRTDFMASIVQ